MTSLPAITRAQAADALRALGLDPSRVAYLELTATDVTVRQKDERLPRVVTITQLYRED